MGHWECLLNRSLHDQIGSHTQLSYAPIPLWYHIPLKKKKNHNILNNLDFVIYKKTQNGILCFQMAYTGEQINDLLIPEEKKISTQASVCAQLQN